MSTETCRQAVALGLVTAARTGFESRDPCLLFGAVFVVDGMGPESGT